jgi:DNA-binding CsgD family transcriptional regulator
MKLSYRKAGLADFDAFYAHCFMTFGYSDELRAKVMREWKVLARNPLSHSLVVEDGECPPSERIVAYAMATFVSDVFVDWARTDMNPYLNAHIIEPMPDGSSAMSSEDELRRMNATGGLNIYIAHWGWQDYASESDTFYARSFLHEKFWQIYHGYRIKSLMVEVAGDHQLAFGLNSGLKIWRDFEEHYRLFPAERPSEQRCRLLGVTVEDAQDLENTLIGRVFAFSEPRFAFTDREQQVLRMALAGDTDAEIGDALFISESTVKGIIRAACERVRRVDKALLAESPDGRRGKEKRRDLLRYLADHPEELRPTPK